MKRDIIDAALAFSMGVLLLAVAYFLLVGTAHAEEPAYWPPCGAVDQDRRCPGQALPRCPDARMEVVWLVGLDSVSWSCLPVKDGALVMPRRPVTFVRVVDTSAAPSPHHPAELQCTP